MQERLRKPAQEGDLRIAFTATQRGCGAGSGASTTHPAPQPVLCTRLTNPEEGRRSRLLPEKQLPESAKLAAKAACGANKSGKERRSTRGSALARS